MQPAAESNVAVGSFLHAVRSRDVDIRIRLLYTFESRRDIGGEQTMVDYFIVNYARLEHGFIFLTANYFIAAGVPFALTDLGKNVSSRAVLVLILKTLCCIAAGEIVASLYHWISGGEPMLVPLVADIVVTAVYAVAFSKLKMPVRLMRAAEYVGMSALTICVTSSIGGILGLGYSYLQWVLI